MAKVQFVIGLDVDLYENVEKIRGKIPRATYLNAKLRDIILPVALPSTEEELAASPKPNTEVVEE
jgi:hypothetical protein